MSDLTRAGKNHLLASAAVGGLLSGLFYSSAVLAFVFLVPIQICYGRRGQWAGLAAAVIALFVAVLGQFISLLIGTGFVLSAIQNFEMRQFLLFGILPPAVLLLSLVLMNAPFWTKDLDYARGFAGAAIASIAAIPGIVALGRDSSFIAFFEEHLNAFVKPLLAQAGNSFEASALQASFNAKALAQSSLKIISSSFSALFLALLAASWWLGNRMAGVGSRGQEEAPPLADYRLPSLLVWPFLIAWAGVLAVSYFKLGMPVSAVAWNLALALSLAYAVQGLGIASHFMRRWNLPRSLRICIAVTAVILLVTPPIGTACIAILPLLGVTEVWIPYRNLKGVGA